MSRHNVAFPSYAPTPLIPGATQRENYLLIGARGGISLHCEGGRSYDRHMRRLVDRGLMKIARPASRGSARISRLVATDAGIASLEARGIDWDPDPRPAKAETHAPYWQPTEGVRSVLVDAARCVVQRIARSGPIPSEYDEEGFRITRLPTLTSFVAQSFKPGRPVYHWQPGSMYVTDLSELIPAGVLRRTGKGLVLERSNVLSLAFAHPMDVPKGFANRLDELEAVTGRYPNLITHRPRTGGVRYYMILQNISDVVTTRMLFCEAEVFTGFGGTRD